MDRAGKKSLPSRFRRAIHVIDATTIQLVANCMSWAKHRRRKASVKYHLLPDLLRFLPRFAIVDTAGEHDNVRDLYRSHWQIEVFCKQLKQTMQLIDFLGNSANAVKWQVWSALWRASAAALPRLAGSLGAQLHAPVHLCTRRVVAATRPRRTPKNLQISSGTLPPNAVSSTTPHFGRMDNRLVCRDFMVALNYSATAVVSVRPAREALSRLEAQRDVILVSRFKAGDEAAFVEIVTHYRAKMLHAAQSMLRNRADAEEISQDTFIRAYRNLATFRGESSLAAWLYCITLNLSRNRYWYFFRRRRHTSLSLDAALGEASTVTLADVMTSDEPSPVRETVNNEFSALVAHCADQLPAHQREILLLRSHQHHTYVHISRLLGIGVGTVKSRIARARANLRILVAKTHPEFSRDATLFDCFESFRACHHQAAICS